MKGGTTHRIWTNCEFDTSFAFDLMIIICHRELCRWLWAKLLQETLTQFTQERNSFKSRKDNDKPGPSGMSRNHAFSMPEQWNGKNCLLPVDVAIIQEIKKEMGGDEILEFVSQEFSECAETTY